MQNDSINTSSAEELAKQEAEKEYQMRMKEQMYREDRLERRWGIPTFA